jgi:hypothetical protein
MTWPVENGMKHTSNKGGLEIAGPPTATVNNNLNDLGLGFN